jgi:hypothetical protein
MSRPRERQEDRPASPRSRGREVGRDVAVVVSLAGHVLIALALLSARIDPPPIPPVEPITVSLVEPPPPPPPPPDPPPKPSTPAAAAAPAPAKPPPRSPLRPPLKPPPNVEPLPTSEEPVPEPVLAWGAGELAGAATAGRGAGGGGNGGSGGGCDMVRLLQDALRKNPRVQAAIKQAHPEVVAAGKAIVVWNGDWVRSPGQAGKGFAGVRELMIVEIAFAPEACRADPVHGLVLISLSDAPDAARIALGTRTWRWSDLVFARGTRPSASRPSAG